MTLSRSWLSPVNEKYARNCLRASLSPSPAKSKKLRYSFATAWPNSVLKNREKQVVTADMKMIILTAEKALLPLHFS
jgi:hypothetical protein